MGMIVVTDCQRTLLHAMVKAASTRNMKHMMQLYMSITAIIFQHGHSLCVEAATQSLVAPQHTACLSLTLHPCLCLPAKPLT